jgi:nucleotide-binding universal stress UspA family protein
MSGVVVGVDGSAASMDALRWAANQADTMNQSLTVVAVVDPTTLRFLGNDDEARSARLDVARQDIEVMLEKLEAERGVPLPGPVTVRARIGAAVDELVAAAEDAPLLVVGSRGAGPDGAGPVGSVSADVVRRATCSVVVVRGRDEPHLDPAG